ncbi:hypothetical protein POI8812_01891 [Pontivivens insulae]|uniref:Uncharacterized protein n=1 Tax=Pontivivens insulae TaxID=1639689 RepID=A0A2R8ABZ5_9RHOB|nr:hypothetical protein POI8812_01891 [Pontivivens insulae]
MDGDLVHHLRNAVGVVRYGDRPDGLAVGTHQIFGADRDIWMEWHDQICILRLQPHAPRFSNIPDPTIVLRVLLSRRRKALDSAQALASLACRNLRRIFNADTVSAFALHGNRVELRGCSSIFPNGSAELAERVDAGMIAEQLRYCLLRVQPEQHFVAFRILGQDEPQLTQVRHFTDQQALQHDAIAAFGSRAAGQAVLCVRDESKVTGVFFFETSEPIALSADVAASLALYAGMEETARIFR